MAPFKFPINDWDGNGNTDDLYDIFMERKICQNFAPKKEENLILDPYLSEGIEPDFDSDDNIVDESIEEQEVTIQFELESDYDWRDNFKDIETYGISPYDYNTQEEFIEAYNKAEELYFQKIEEEQRRKMEKAKEETQKKIKEYEEKQNKFRLELELRAQQEKEADLSDSNEYIYCGVKFDENPQIFHYITDNESVAVGDNVLVPVGYANNETPAVVVSVKKYLRINAPYPFAKTKKIIKIV